MVPFHVAGTLGLGEQLVQSPAGWNGAQTGGLLKLLFLLSLLGRLFSVVPSLPSLLPVSFC